MIWAIPIVYAIGVVAFTWWTAREYEEECIRIGIPFAASLVLALAAGLVWPVVLMVEVSERLGKGVGQ